MALGGRGMKEYIRKRVLDICDHILQSKHTVRQAAVVFGVSKSTVHKDIPKVNGEESQKAVICDCLFSI